MPAKKSERDRKIAYRHETLKMCEGTVRIILKGTILVQSCCSHERVSTYAHAPLCTPTAEIWKKIYIYILFSEKEIFIIKSG